MKLTSLLTKTRFASLLCAGLLSLAAIPAALATDLPPGVLNYLRQKDPHVKVRFDGVVLFSNGESYVPVIPQDPSLNADSQQVISTIPEKVAYPDLIQFDNNFFLMRLIQTASGRLTFPKLADYPIQLKEGLLPQDFVMPGNLYIPVELKVILGALPYSPTYDPVSKPSLPPAAVMLRNAAPATGAMPVVSHVTYVFDLEGQKILAIDPITGHKQGDVDVACVPSNLTVSPDGKLLFVPCLSTNELVVVDTGSNLVKTRIPVGQRPDAVLYLSQSQDVVVSNRYSQFISVINSNKLTEAQQVTLPGNGGALAVVPGNGTPRLVVADAFNDQLYLVNLNTLTVEKTFKALPDISSLKVFRDAKGHMEIWVASRSKDQVMLLDGVSGNALKTMNVGAKPVEMIAYDDKLFVVSAGDSRIDVINRADQSKYTTIQLEEDSFPSGLVLVPTEKRGYVTLAASHHFVVLNLDTLQVDSTMPVNFRAGMIAMTPDKLMVAQETDTAAMLSGNSSQARQSALQPPEQAHHGKDQPEKAANKARASQRNGLLTRQAKPPENGTPASAVPMEPQQVISPQANPLQNGGKFHLRLGGREKTKPSAPVSSGSNMPVEAMTRVKPATAMPLDLQVADPSSTASPKPESTLSPGSQDDLVK